MLRTVNGIFILSVFLSFNPGVSGKTPASPVFYKTENSDEWVSHTLHIQKRYARVWVVAASGHTPQTVNIPLLDLNSRERSDRESGRRYKVAGVFKTLQEAADVGQGGDLIAVMPGTYAGFVLGEKPDAGDDHYLCRSR